MLKMLMGGILIVVFLAIMFPIVLDSINEAQTESQLDEFNGCVVADGETDVVLTLDLYEARLTSVTALTASDSETPNAASYVEGTKTLTVDGLGATTPQDITVTYLYDRTTDFTGLSSFMRLTPLFLWIAALGGLIGGGIFVVARSRR